MPTFLELVKEQRLLAAGGHHLRCVSQAAGEGVVPVPVRVQGVTCPHLRQGLGHRQKSRAAPLIAGV